MRNDRITLRMFNFGWLGAEDKFNKGLVLKTCMEAGVFQNMKMYSIPKEDWSLMFTILESSEFVEVLHEYFNGLKEKAMTNEKALSEIRNIIDTILILIRSGENTLTGSIANDYLDLLADIVEFYRVTYNFILKRNESLDNN